MEDDPKWLELTTEVVKGLSPSDGLSRAISAFEPLRFEPGTGARDWLQARMAERHVPIETYLRLQPPGSDEEVLGFFAMESVRVDLSDRDRTLLRFRRRKVTEDLQPASQIAWMARSQSSEPGLGRDLFEYALGHAILNGSVTLLVEPHDDATAEMWHREFRFMPVDEPAESAGGPRRLWYPVDRPPQAGPS